jgi:mannose-1-phosphate guanylyltransferase/mannose-6-phosphate isomerase
MCKANSKATKITPVILCGGEGSRLWPLSRLVFPKQFLSFSGNKSLFQQTIERFQSINNQTAILNETVIVTNENHRFLVLDQLCQMKVSDANLILEPIGKNTAPALTIAALQAINNGDDPILVVSPADHVVQDQNAFINIINNSIHLAEIGSIVIFGIIPTSPDSGFGYIQADKKKGEFDEYKVLSFTEKPDSIKAKEYIDAGCFWNSGIFVLRATLWLEAIKYFSPEIYEASFKAFNQRTYDYPFMRPDEMLFNDIPTNSIDSAVIGKCCESSFNIKMLKLNTQWSDLGTWDAVWRVGNKDIDGNVSYGDTLLQNTSNSLIYSSNRLVVTSYVKDLVVVETADSIMVTDRQHSQEIRKIVSTLHLQKRNERNLHRKIFRPWGWFDVLDEETKFKVKRLCVIPGRSLSMQRHNYRSEHWVVVKGKARVKCGGKEVTLCENESIYIPKRQFHQLSNLESDLLEIVEVQSGDYLGEDDIERLDSNY